MEIKKESYQRDVRYHRWCRKNRYGHRVSKGTYYATIAERFIRRYKITLRIGREKDRAWVAKLARRLGTDSNSGGAERLFYNYLFGSESIHNIRPKDVEKFIARWGRHPREHISYHEGAPYTDLGDRFSYVGVFCPVPTAPGSRCKICGSPHNVPVFRLESGKDKFLGRCSPDKICGRIFSWWTSPRAHRRRKIGVPIADYLVFCARQAAGKRTIKLEKIT